MMDYRADLSPRFGPHNFECLIGEEAGSDGNHIELAPSQDRE